MTVLSKTARATYKDLQHAVRLAKINNPGIRNSDVSYVDIEVSVTFDIGDFQDDEIISAFEKLNALDDSDRWHVEQAYRRMAEGDMDAAMDILHRAFDLAPPSHEKKLADLLTVDRG